MTTGAPVVTITRTSSCVAGGELPRDRFGRRPVANIHSAGEAGAKAAAAATKTCPQCLETIPEAARKCRACASAL